MNKEKFLYVKDEYIKKLEKDLEKQILELEKQILECVKSGHNKLRLNLTLFNKNYNVYYFMLMFQEYYNKKHYSPVFFECDEYNDDYIIFNATKKFQRKK